MLYFSLCKTFSDAYNNYGTFGDYNDNTFGQDSYIYGSGYDGSGEVSVFKPLNLFLSACLKSSIISFKYFGDQQHVCQICCFHDFLFRI